MRATHKPIQPGDVFGKLTVVSKCEERTSSRGILWLTKCECGGTKKVTAGHLTDGDVRSCGCLMKDDPHLDMVGKKFGHLTVKEHGGYSYGDNGRGREILMVTCDCSPDKIFPVTLRRLKSGNSQSCGCYRQKIKINPGDVFGHLTVISKCDGATCLCKCVCDTLKKVRASHLHDGTTTSCGCMMYANRHKRPHVELIGKRFGKLTAVELGGYNKWEDELMKCVCDCSQITYVTVYRLIRGDTQSCGCLTLPSGRDSPYWKGCGDISGAHWTIIKTSAKERGIPFEIDLESTWSLFESQEGKCALTGLPISFKDNTASLDRIDSNFGYVRSNVWWVDKTVNRIKWKVGLDYFITLCGLVCGKVKLDQVPNLTCGDTLPSADLAQEHYDPAIPLIDLVGSKFGKLTVVSFLGGKGDPPYRSLYWNSICDCGKTIAVAGSRLRNGFAKSCGCIRKGWQGCGELSGKYWNHVISKAKIRELSFDISIEYAWKLLEQQGGYCALTGLPITCGDERKKQAMTASLDRINNDQAYVEGNVRWIFKDINPMKKDFPDDVFLKTCAAVWEHSGHRVDLGSVKRHLAKPRKINKCGEQAEASKLKEYQVLEIWGKRKGGQSVKSLAEEYGVTTSSISHIMKGNRWKHLNLCNTAPNRTAEAQPVSPPATPSPPHQPPQTTNVQQSSAESRIDTAQGRTPMPQT